MENEEEELNEDYTADKESAAIKTIDQQIAQLNNLLKVPNKLRKLAGGSIAGYMLAKLLKQSDTAATLAAAGGAYIGFSMPAQELTDEQRQAINSKIEQLMKKRRAILADVKVQSGEALTAQELTTHEIERYHLGEPWNELIGQPSIPFQTLIFGKPKSGKSIMSLIFADHLARNCGSVLYIASEEGYKGTLKDKVNEFTTKPENLHFVDLRDFEQIYDFTDRKKFDFVFIDSVDFCKITADQVEILKANNPATSFAIVKQATKGGDFRGSQEFAHNCDVIIEVKDGVAYSKGRFNAGGEIPIFE